MTEKKELEELEKQFILNEDLEYKDIKDLISRILKYCKIDKNGFVVIQKSGLIIKQKIMLVLSARYLANKLQQQLNRKEDNISEEVSTKEISSIIKEKNSVVVARLKDLKDDKKVISSVRGIYKIAPYSIKNFLKELEGGKNG